MVGAVSSVHGMMLVPVGSTPMANAPYSNTAPLVAIGPLGLRTRHMMLTAAVALTCDGDGDGEGVGFLLNQVTFWCKLGFTAGTSV